MLQNSADQCAGRHRHGVFQHCLRAAAARCMLCLSPDCLPPWHRRFPVRRLWNTGRKSAGSTMRHRLPRGTGAAAQPVHVSAGGAVCHADRRPAPCPVLSACHCTGGTVRLPDCRGTGLLGRLAEHDPHGVVAGTGSGGEAGLRTGTVHVGAPESGGRLPLGAAGGAAFGTGCRGSRAGCHAIYSAGVGVLPVAWSAAGYPTAPR